MYSIAIDGPAGAGKSTIAKGIAQRLSFIYVDTGALYRAMAYYFIKHKIPASDLASIEAGCQNMDILIQYTNQVQQVLVNGENITARLRTEEVGKMASAIAALPVVREKLLELQRNLAVHNHVVMDGRDIGTCVLPNATIKIYMTASSRVRALRRYEELTAKQTACQLEEIEADIIDRDERDMNRDIAPLKQAEDAIYLDTSEMTIEEVITAIIAAFDQRKEPLV